MGDRDSKVAMAGSTGRAAADGLYEEAVRLAAKRPAKWRLYYQLLRRAADEGSWKARCLYANLLLQGHSSRSTVFLAADPAAAVKLLRRIARARIPDAAMAQFQLGSAYDDGTGVVRSVARAIEWYRKAAKSGVDDAYFNIGMLELERGDSHAARASFAKIAGRHDEGKLQLKALDHEHRPRPSKRAARTKKSSSPRALTSHRERRSTTQ